MPLHSIAGCFALGFSEKSLGVSHTLTLPPPGLAVEVDPTRLTQIFMNLLSNAARYTPRGGRIWLSAKQQENDVVVSVKDTGAGIPPELLNHVFDMFMQVHPVHVRSQGGLGIGLTLVKRLVEMHGGRVSAFSDGEGHGAEFVVCLPVAPTGLQPEPSSIEDEASRAPVARRSSSSTTTATAAAAWQ